MATLYVENVPDELYEALRDRAKRNRLSIARQTIEILERELPSRKELAARRKLLKQVLGIRSRSGLWSGPGPSAEEMIREDRER